MNDGAVWVVKTIAWVAGAVRVTVGIALVITSYRHRIRSDPVAAGDLRLHYGAATVRESKAGVPGP